MTNTTSRPRATVVAELGRLGLAVRPEDVFTAGRAGYEHLRRRGFARCDLLVRAGVLEDFPGIDPAAGDPQAVVLGDLGPETSFDRLNRAFRHVLAGSELVTLARNRYFRAGDGLTLDVGAFAAALEYATGQTATLVGKPAAEFFQTALAGGAALPSETLVVGDDLESDVGGAQGAGMLGALVRTGKFRPEELARRAISPDAVLDSIADVPALLDGDGPREAPASEGGPA